MRRSSLLSFLMTGALAALVPAASAQEAATVVIVKAAHLIDGRGGAPLSPVMVRIEGERLAAVGQSLPVPAGVRVMWDPLESTCRHASLSIL